MKTFLAILLIAARIAWCWWSGEKFGMAMVFPNTVLGFGIGWIIGELHD